MGEQERLRFLSEGTRTAKLATVRADGSPHVVPIWFVLDDDGALVFNVDGGSLKAKALKRDPRVSLCVDDQTPPYSFVLLEGTAEVSYDVDEMLPWSTRIGARYMGAEAAEAFGRRNAVPGELLVRLRPTRVVARAGIAD
ncbi:MAG TPA: PPOX class F420-dependent oxidoreductase [Actinomycetes bacterium]